MVKYLLLLSLIGLSFTKGLEAYDFYLSFTEKEDAFLIDIRLWEDYTIERLPNSLWGGQLSQLEEIIEGLNTNTPIYLYCTYNKRSIEVSKILRKKGFKQIYTLDGGIEDWKKSGFPIDTIALPIIFNKVDSDE